MGKIGHKNLGRTIKVKRIYEVPSEGITGTFVDIKLLFAVIPKCLTRKTISGSELLDTKVLDHLIINPDGNYFSFSDEGII